MPRKPAAAKPAKKPPAKRKPSPKPKPIESHLEAICGQLAEGKSLRSICRKLGIDEGTVRSWLNRDATAKQRVVAARELGCDSLADEVLEIADEKTADPADRRVRIDARLRLIGKWSQRYADKVTHTGPDGGPIQTETRATLDIAGLNDEQLRALASIRVRSE